MRFPHPLAPGRLVQRYKRFLCDVTISGGVVVTAACPNTGSMLGLTTPGSLVWLSESDKATRKYRHTWEMIEIDMGQGPRLVGINPGHPNGLVAEAIGLGAIPELSGYAKLRREVRYGEASRIDMLFESPDRPPCYVEVKNVHFMRKRGTAEFPDSRTERGTKHLKELAREVALGNRGVMVFLVQRDDADSLSIATDIDPDYAAAFELARRAGVEMLCYRCKLTPQDISVDRRIDIAFT